METPNLSNFGGDYEDMDFVSSPAHTPSNLQT
jgi:hypothetical protein